MIIGVISDTHGLIRPEALDALKAAELIIHAGDVGRMSVLKALETIAPVAAVKGNIDRGQLADDLPEVRVVEAGSVRICVIHIVENLKLNPVAESFKLVVAGHSHIPSISERNGVVYLNPGSAGPRRFNLPASVALVEVSHTSVDVRIVRLEISMMTKSSLDLR